MILHIAPEDDKFIPFLQGLFEETKPASNLWRILGGRTGADDSIRVIDGGYFASKAFREDLKRSDCIIFHCLALPMRQVGVVLANLPDGMPLLWRGWGVDYYRLLVAAKGLELVMPETLALATGAGIEPPPSLAWRVRSRIQGLFEGIGYARILRRWLRRVDYFSCCIPDDHEALVGALPDFSATFLPLNYYSIEDVFLRGVQQPELAGKDILLGNSATPTNNHIEVLGLLKGLELGATRVVVPLSYGNSGYRDRLARLGRELLGPAFVPLVEFMPIAEYNRVVSNCGNVVMNHVRQQAVGNISAALLRGGKVFLHPASPILKYYSRLGCELHSISGGLGPEDFSRGLDPAAVERNRAIMLDLWSRARGLAQARAIFDLCGA